MATSDPSSRSTTHNFEDPSRPIRAEVEDEIRLLTVVADVEGVLDDMLDVGVVEALFVLVTAS
jgi:hypothetical protein